MNTFMKTVFAGAIGAITMAMASSAFAGNKQDHNDPDHRSHKSNDYDHDNYYRADPYRNSGVSFSITVGDDRYRDRRRYARHDNYRGKRHGYRGRDGRVVNRQVFDTRHRARIVLIEEVVRTKRGPRLICTVEARGRDAGYVPKRRLKRIARNNCSPRARVRIYA